jgi:PadR family transcriptional regulator, regulatory protein AphA
MATPKRSPFAVPVVLGLLLIGPRHGYALFSQVQRDLRDVWDVAMNRLYGLLDEMEQGGLIAGHVERSGTRPQRRVFRCTAKGRRQFERWMAEPSVRMSELRTDFPPRLYFALQRGPQDVAQLLQAQRGACARELARMTARKHELGGANAFRDAVYSFRVHQIQAALAWLDATERALVAMPARASAEESRK